MMQIQLLAYDGFRERDAFGALEVLHLAIAAGAELRIELVRLGSATVTSAYGLQLHVPGLLTASRAPGLLIVPGSGWSAESGDNEAGDPQRQRISAALSAFPRPSTTLATTGTGVLLLARAGLLAHRNASCPDSVANEVRESGAEIVPARVVDDGDIVTAVGATAGLDLTLWLVERFVGSAFAHRVERRLGYERRGTVWRSQPS